jgi:hypothetical protein
MAKLAMLLILAVWTLPAFAAKEARPEAVSVRQLEVRLAAAHGLRDAELARQLSGLELTERLSAPRFARLKADLPGEKAREALLILADTAAFLDPPDDEVPNDPTPDPVALRQMMTRIITYVNTSVRQLPNLIATRDTTGFEDRPQQDVLEATGISTLFYEPLHATGRTSVMVTYRNRLEVVVDDAHKYAKLQSPIHGLVSTGEFGPFLSFVMADAVRGKITWNRWEKGAGGTEAVFHYTVPLEKAHFHVRFCCISESGSISDGHGADRDFDEVPAYHGDIVFDPATGAIFRLTAEAEIPPGELVSKAAMLVEYGPAEIGGKTYICPLKSVSMMLDHATAIPGSSTSQSSPKGPLTTFMNDVAFGHFRRFGSETRILTSDSPDSGEEQPAAAPSVPAAH